MGERVEYIVRVALPDRLRSHSLSVVEQGQWVNRVDADDILAWASVRE